MHRKHIGYDGLLKFARFRGMMVGNLEAKSVSTVFSGPMKELDRNELSSRPCFSLLVKFTERHFTS